jgi:hypothetical protein
MVQRHNDHTIARDNRFLHAISSLLSSLYQEIKFNNTEVVQVKFLDCWSTIHLRRIVHSHQYKRVARNAYNNPAGASILNMERTVLSKISLVANK